MTDPRIAGFLINAALFLGLLGVAGIAWHDPLLAALSFGSVGAAAICYVAQLCAMPRVALGFMVFSWTWAVVGFGLFYARHLF